MIISGIIFMEVGLRRYAGISSAIDRPLLDSSVQKFIYLHI